METGAMTAKIGKTFFVFTDKDLFLVSESEYKEIRQNEEGRVFLKGKYLLDRETSDVAIVICIVCHGEAAPEDLISPLCRQMHFVLCRECIEYLKKRTGKIEVVCPYCSENKGDEMCQEEILGAVVSLMSRKTFLYLDMKPELEVEAVMRLTRETKVVLSNVWVYDALFFRLMSRTTVVVRDKITILRKDNMPYVLSLDPAWAPKHPEICFSECTKEETEQIRANMEMLPENRTPISPWKIRRKGKEIRALLRFWACVDESSESVFLKFPEKNSKKETLGEGNNSLWIGKVEKLSLYNRAMEVLPKLKFHEENEMSGLKLRAAIPRCVAEIHKMENKSIWIGKTRKLELKGYAIQIFPKLGFHKENMVEEIYLCSDSLEQIAGIVEMENNSIWVGRVKKLELHGYAIQIFPRLGFHEENVIEKLSLDSYDSEYIAEILRAESNSVWIWKVKCLDLCACAIQILPNLGIHGEYAVDELALNVGYLGYISGILGVENNSVWIGRVRKLRLEDYAITILPKLRFHKENVMEELVLDANEPEHISGMLGMENNSIWIGKVKALNLIRHANRIRHKLSFTPREPNTRE
ncbi:MAG: uncharacterized protein A8A55_1240 [Amphiamblys sp. WSBS2006]|nr:MAG: uncharacterized protein A8A55_1240 [Amphiamblys sp. WSBS2006]